MNAYIFYNDKIKLLSNLKKFISVPDIHTSIVLHVICNTSYMSRTDGASWSQFLRASVLVAKRFVTVFPCPLSRLYPSKIGCMQVVS